MPTEHDLTRLKNLGKKVYTLSMWKNVSHRENRCFTIALFGFGLLFMVAFSLFSVVAVRAFKDQQELQTIRDEFDRQHTLWKAQNIQNYRVRYTNCNGLVCCQGVTMTVHDGILQNTQPDCSSTGGLVGYTGYTSINSMDQMYFWLDDWLRYNEDRRITVSYHPELHYITHLEFVPYGDITPEVISYEALEVMHN
ncbi:MAG TPA: DUF6174 domain-containing protein [Aggregatilineales bacterium]|nr:DUF6174 domain-containing protein [Aggregatilineales bacterium]